MLFVPVYRAGKVGCHWLMTLTWAESHHGGLESVGLRPLCARRGDVAAVAASVIATVLGRTIVYTLPWYSSLHTILPHGIVCQY